MNIPPKPDGTFDERDVKRLGELGKKIESSFLNNLAEGREIKILPYCGSETQCTVEIDFGKEEKINYLEFCENIADGQRIESFFVQKYNDSRWENCFEGTTVGAKRIVSLNGLTTEKIRIFVTASRDKPDFGKIAVY